MENLNEAKANEALSLADSILARLFNLNDFLDDLPQVLFILE